MTQKRDHILLLNALKELPFPVGKKLLFSLLRGKNHETIQKHRLDRLSSHASLAYSEEELETLFQELIYTRLIEIKGVDTNKHMKVVHLTQKGTEEIKHPTFKKDKPQLRFEPVVITEQDKALFHHFDFFLQKYNNEQKKAIISQAKQILCIAGAGTGKTTVLTKRIEFLTQFSGINPKKILAVTFTRKAKQEMESRLANNPYSLGVEIETFNSFSERILKKHNHLISDKPITILSFGEKIRLVHHALKKQQLDINQAIYNYFTTAQRRLKTEEELARIFVNDCFSILDYYKNENKPFENFTKHPSLTPHEQKLANIVYQACISIEKEMKEKRKRDFTDQIVDCVALFKQNKEHIPQFEHILVDEYQDINPIQIELLIHLNPPNLFAVGDPRQAIFAWRGSKVDYIFNFKQTNPESEVITLTKNYRSQQNLVTLMNKAIQPMRLPNLEHASKKEENTIILQTFPDQETEFNTIIQEITKSTLPKEEIFVLARTNRTLLEFSERLKSAQIPHIIRSDEIRRTTGDKEGAVTLATVHAIKGLEALYVFLIGCDSNNFPCRASDHPIVDVVKANDADIEEERRLFYVAISRAKQSLCLTASTKQLTPYITTEMLTILGGNKTINRSYKENNSKKLLSDPDVFSRLRTWRNQLAQELNVPAYIICHDSTLQELTTQNPLSLDDLHDITGLGPVKIRKYGKQILEVLQGY